MNTLGIRNVVAAVNILDDNLRQRFEDVTRLSITKLETLNDLRAIPRVVLTRPGDAREVNNKSGVLTSLFIGRDSKSSEFQIVARQDGRMILDCESLETGFHPLDCSNAPWISVSILVWQSDFVGVWNGQGVIRIEGLPSDADLELLLFHESAAGRRLIEMDVGGRLQKEKNRRLRFRLQAGENDLGEIFVKGGQFERAGL